MRTLLALGLLSVSAVCISAGIAAATTASLYLQGGAPRADLTAAAPPAAALPNYDPGRDSEPGLVLAPTDAGSTETDPARYVMWIEPNDGSIAEIDGTVTVTLWSAMSGFDAGSGATVSAHLLECAPGGGTCTLLDTAVSTGAPWSPSGSWTQKIFAFGQVDHTVSPNRAIAVKVTVDASSDGPVWFAYGTAEYPARMAIDGTVTTTSSSTTTTSSSTTTTMPTTTMPPTTSTTLVGSGPTVPPPTAPPSTMPDDLPDTASTTTTVAPTTTSTTRAAAPGVEEPPGGVDAPRSGAPQNPISGADPIIASLGAAPSEASPGRAATWGGSLVAGLELVIPPWAAGIVASPLLVLLFLFASLTDSGREILLPAGVLVTGLVLMLLESRLRPAVRRELQRGGGR